MHNALSVYWLIIKADASGLIIFAVINYFTRQFYGPNKQGTADKESSVMGILMPFVCAVLYHTLCIMRNYAK